MKSMSEEGYKTVKNQGPNLVVVIYLILLNILLKQL